MSDIVERAHSYAAYNAAKGADVLIVELADEITRLRASEKALLEAAEALLDEIESDEEHGGGADDSDCPICVKMKALRAAIAQATERG